MTTNTVWKCGGCCEEVLADDVQPEIDNDGCYFICPECGARNPLVNVAASMGGEEGDIWLAQPSIFGTGWKPGRE